MKIHNEYDDFCFKLDDNRELFTTNREIEDEVKIFHGNKYYYRDTYCLESDVDLPITFFVENVLVREWFLSINRS